MSLLKPSTDYLSTWTNLVGWQQGKIEVKVGALTVSECPTPPVKSGQKELLKA